MPKPGETNRKRRRIPCQDAVESAIATGKPSLATDVHEALLDLAYDVSSMLRHHSRPAIRISAALLLAASLAACSGGAPSGDSVVSAGSPPADVEPLQREVRSGLPTDTGRYPLVSDSLTRDQQGVYHFSWLRPGESGVGNSASISQVRMAQDSTEYLEVPERGDPILNLRHNSVVQMASMAGAGTPTTSSYGYWRPFYGGGYYYYGPSYYEPPVRTIATGGGIVDGSRASSAQVPAAERTLGLSRAVSGSAGGTGSGTAATTKSGASVAAVGGKSASVAAAKSSGFSGGGAATSKGGGSGSGASSS
jgi:hypothetical protein